MSSTRLVQKDGGWGVVWSDTMMKDKVWVIQLAGSKYQDVYNIFVKVI